MSRQIKIFVSYHKPSQFIKSDILTPIEVGAEINTVVNKAVVKDNTGDNISILNPKFCELTAQYWAWKNQNLDYYGFFHYRRYLAFNTDYRSKTDNYGNIVEPLLDDAMVKKYGWSDELMRKKIEKFDILLPDLKDIKTMPRMGKNMRKQYIRAKNLHIKDLNIMYEVLEEKYPEYIPFLEEYLGDSKTYFNNMFVMKKEIFFDYCKWLFDILFECDKRINYTGYNKESTRVIGHLAERLLNVYILYLKNKTRNKIGELPTVYFLDTEPKFKIETVKKGAIPIVLAANENYAPYLATTIVSIKKNAKKGVFYDISIIHKNINEKSQNIILKLKDDNFSIRFFDISSFENRFRHLFRRGHFTIETWFRLLMPEIMPDYDKAIYLDCDLVVEQDLSQLYKFRLDNFLLAACKDPDTAGLYNGASFNKRNYMDNVLKIKKPYNYFQAGVLLLNLRKFRETFSTDELFKFAASKKFDLLDQDVLNYLAQGKVKFLDMTWNVMFDWKNERIEKIISKAPNDLFDAYMEARKKPKIIHYAGPEKPWMDPTSDYADNFWKYAKESGFYETIVTKMLEYQELEKRKKKNTLKKHVTNSVKKIFPENTSLGLKIRKIHARIRKI